MLLWFVIVYWLISVGIGLLAATRVHNTKDFAVAGRHLPFYMVTATVFATWFGSETVLGIPATFLNEGLHGVVADPFGSSMCLILVGLFFADVVSARDLRSFYLPEFEQLRIPQWAARAEYYFGDTHAELVWIPVPSYDRIGKPGAEFYPLPKDSRVFGEVKPDNSLGNTNWGGRLSRLIGGWDLSAFYYRSLDVAQTFYVTGFNGLQPEFQPRHDRISQLGGTFAKDFGEFVLKGEVVVRPA